MTKAERQQLDMFPDSPEAIRIRANEALELRCKIEAILRNAAVEIRPCRACGTQLFLVRNNGPIREAPKLTPYEANGTNHFATCPQAQKFTKAKR